MITILTVLLAAIAPRASATNTSNDSTTPAVDEQLEELCPWLVDTGDESYECNDGSSCTQAECCEDRGGRARCPASEPVMCLATTCGDDYCCSNVTSNCHDALGPRPCISGHSVAAGSDQVVFILEANGEAWAMGGNFRGQLGTGGTSTVREPTIVMTDVLKAAVGQYHAAIIKQDGSLWTSGRNNQGQLCRGNNFDEVVFRPAGTGILDAAVNGLHTVVINDAYEVWACGWNSEGQLGDNTTESRRSPVPVFTDTKALAVGSAHSVFLRRDGTVWATGANEVGELGDGTTVSRKEPVMVFESVSQTVTVIAIAAGTSHTVCLTADGAVWSTGYNFYGQLADGTDTDRSEPVRAQGTGAVTSISAGQHHTLMLQADGAAFAVGWNGNGQLGDGTLEDIWLPFRTASEVAAVYAGGRFSYFLMRDGSMLGCGANEVRQLGFSTINDRAAPVQILPDHFVRWTTTTTAGTTTITGVTGEQPVSTVTTRTTTVFLGPTYEEEEMSVLFLLVAIVTPLVLCCCCVACGLVFCEIMRQRHQATKETYKVSPDGPTDPVQESYNAWRKPVVKKANPKKAAGPPVVVHAPPSMMAAGAWQRPSPLDEAMAGGSGGPADAQTAPFAMRSPVAHAEGPSFPGPPVGQTSGP